MDNGGIEEGWQPSPPPAIGSPAWKDDIAFQIALAMGAFKHDHNSLVHCGDYKGHHIGVLAIRRLSNGWDYFRIEQEYT